MAQVRRQRPRCTATSSSARARSRRATCRCWSSAVAWAGALLHALLLWRAGDLTLGEVVAFMGLLGTLRFPTFISIFTFNLVQLGVASARAHPGVDQHRDRAGRERRRASPSRSAARWRFEDVSFGYDGKRGAQGTSASAPSPARPSPSSGRPARARRP